MCVQFAYYVKSLAMNKNGTILTMEARGCYAVALWVQQLDDSQDWQLARVSLGNFACSVTVYLTVQQTETIAVPVAFDNIQIAQCSSFNSTFNS